MGIRRNTRKTATLETPYKLGATTAPGVNNDENDSVNASNGIGFKQGSYWEDGVAGEIYRCIDPTDGAAVWIKTSLTIDELGTAALINVGDGADQIPQIDSTLVTDQIVEAIDDGGQVKLKSVAKSDAYNKSFGTGSGNVADAGVTRAFATSEAIKFSIVFG